MTNSDNLSSLANELRIAESAAKSLMLEFGDMAMSAMMTWKNIE
jgi:hypothetical protein